MPTFRTCIPLSGRLIGRRKGDPDNVVNWDRVTDIIAELTDERVVINMVAMDEDQGYAEVTVTVDASTDVTDTIKAAIEPKRDETPTEHRQRLGGREYVKDF